jgi:ribonuclease G
MAEQQSAPAGVETEKAQVAKATEVPARAEAKVSEPQIAGFQFSGTQLSVTQLSGTGFSEVQPSEVQPEVPRPTEAAFTETQLTEQGIIEVTEEESESPAAELPPAREEHGRAGEGAAGWQARREESVFPAPQIPSSLPPPQLPPPPTAERGNEQESQGGGERKGLFRRMSGIFGGRSSNPPAPDAAAQERERSKALSVSEGVPAHEAEPWRSHTENVAKLIETQVGGGAAEFESNLPRGAGDSYEQSHAVEDEAKVERTPDERQFLASPFVRSMEEEEIDEEEDDADLAAVGAGFDEEDMEFEELEEESFEPGRREAAAKGDEITHAGDERHMEHGAADEPFESGSAVEERAEGEEGANGRAELRGRPATAPYQQRTERPQFDRRSRGRRGSGGRHMRPRESQRPQIMISDILKEGQEILVQIAKEPIGKKGARITSHIALPGRFMVYMPTVNHIGVSRKISSDEERQRLKRMVSAERENGHGGFIVRTAAEGIHEDELLADIRFLKNLWAEIKQRSETSKPPSLIYHDLNLVERTLRDLVTEDFTHIWVDNEPEYERVLRFVNRFQPGLVRRVRLYTKETPLYEQFGIQEEINKALKSKVWLKSGGYIVINQTEALVAIDVNTGKYVGKTQRLEDTIVKTNVDAIKEIVRQIRLRDLGGIIVVDFIDMDERKNRQKVMQALEEALVHDRAPSKVLAFNDFGLVAITRKRVKHSLERVLGAPCNYCTGTGLVKSVTTVCNEIYIELKKLRKQFESDRDILLRVNPEVAKELKANNSRWLNDLEELAGRPIILKPDPLLHQEQFDM